MKKIYYMLLLTTLLLPINVQSALAQSGSSCNTAITISSLGNYTAAGPDIWYAFTPDTTGLFLVSACNNSCNTDVWIYDYCTGLIWDDTQIGSIAYASAGCSVGATQAHLETGLLKNHLYYIRIGDSGTSCQGTTINWTLSFEGAITGCMDPTACNYNAAATINNSSSCLYPGNPNCPLGPDLTVVQSALESSIQFQTYNSSNTCTVNEGCLQGYGTREIVRFTTHIKNIGNQDYFIGQTPASTSTISNQWEWDACHGHWHYEGYAEYILYDANGTQIPAGFKNGFCVMDLECSGGGTAKFNCSNQGITAGCGDIYNSGLSCQWVDITNVPAGIYTLVVRVNWDKSPDAAGHSETNYLNNWAQVCLQITRSGSTTSVSVVSGCNPYTDCLGQIYGSAQPDCEGTCNGIKKAGDLNNDYVLTTSDANLYKNGIVQQTLSTSTCNDLNKDNKLSVTDIALLNACIWQSQDITTNSSQDYCTLPAFNVFNPNDTARFVIGTHNAVGQYIDIYYKSPVAKIHGLQFDMTGLTLAGVQSLLPAGNNYNGSLQYNSTTGIVLLAPTDTTWVPVAATYMPFARLNYTEATLAVGGVQMNDISVVNREKEEITGLFTGMSSALPANCASAMQVCLNTPFTYPAFVNGNSAELGNNYGCLATTANAGWAYLPINGSGNINIGLTNTLNANIDYALWGPFANLTQAMSYCGSLSAPLQCEYGPATNGTITLTNALAGQVYLMLVTNPSNVATNITLQQTSGTGTIGVSANPATLTACNNGNNTGNFILSQAQVLPPALLGATVQFFTTQADANNNTNPISQTPYVSGAGQVYARVSMGGCAAISTVTLSLATSPQVALAGGTCTAGSISLVSTVSSGTAPYTYLWSDGSTTSSIANPSAGTYTITVTDINGCKATASRTVSTCCATAVRACLNGGGFSWPATTGSSTAETGNNYGCLTSRPRPTWFWLPVATAGSINLVVTCSPAIDIDYAVWGPFSSQSAIPCGALSAPVVCDYTGNVGGSTTLTATAAGQAFLVLVTNYAGSAATITLSQTGGAGYVGVTATATSPLTACVGTNAQLTAGTNAPTGATYQWSGPNGYTATGSSNAISSITLANSGQYIVTVTSAAGCMATAATTLTVSEFPNIIITNNSPICEGQTLQLQASGTSGVTYQWAGPNGYTYSGATITRPNATTNFGGIYGVTGINTMGCFTSIGTTAVVNAPPQAVATSAPVICAGSTLQLAAANAGAKATYQWTGPNGFSASNISPSIPNVSPTASGTYTVLVTDNNGCTASANTTTNITEPTVNAGPDVTIVEGETTTLTASAGINYVWSTGQTTANITVSPTTTTTYSVAVTDSNGCVGSGQVTVTVTPNCLLPTGWLHQDVGNPALAGSVCYNNGVFSIDASGTDIYGTSDKFHYVYVPFNGNGQIIARVVSVENTNFWAKAGVMMRETLNGNSRNAFVGLTSPVINRAFEQHRSSPNAYTYRATTPASAPRWVRLVRNGNVFRAYMSSNGNTWTLIRQFTMNMAANYYVGLAVTARNNSTLNTSVFDNVSIQAGSFKTESEELAENLGSGIIEEMQLSPNPNNGEFGLKIQVNAPSDAHVIINDLAGRELFVQPIVLAEGINEIPLSLRLLNMPSGMYLATLKIGDDERIVQKFLLENK